MNIILSEVETRVLGSLIEKDLTTPEYYPLSLNALVHACNQKSNRHPLMNLDEDAVRQALRSLNQKELAGPADNMDSRVSKFEHRLQEAFNFTRHELAILCELLLRGPQTPGELRSRADRMHAFEDLGIVQSTLQRLMKREPPLAKLLPRQQGTKEARYAHLLSGDMESWAPEPDSGAAVTRISADSERIARLEHEVAGIQKEFADLKQQLAAFQKQFE
ncbi:MAG: YceH family protein [Acidobacteriia bacterium]|nr:YceH family protein [Terriglobia bacterium]